MECMTAELRRLTEGAIDIVIPDHRGTGRSSPLYCGDFYANNSRPCVEEAVKVYGGQLASYSTSNAARDIEAAMRAIGSLKRQQVSEV